MLDIPYLYDKENVGVKGNVEKSGIFYSGGFFLFAEKSRRDFLAFGCGCYIFAAGLDVDSSKPDTLKDQALDKRCRIQCAGTSFPQLVVNIFDRAFQKMVEKATEFNEEYLIFFASNHF